MRKVEVKLELKWVDGERLQILTVADSAIKSTPNGVFPYQSYRQFIDAECEIGLSSVKLSTIKTLTELLTSGYESQSE